MRVPGIQLRVNFLLSRSWIRRASLPIRTLSSESLPSQSCGGLPRFHSQILPSSEEPSLSSLHFFSIYLSLFLDLVTSQSQCRLHMQGEIVRIDGDEFWHMTKVLRLGVNARVELFNGTGGLVEGCIQCIDRNALDVVALEEPKVICPEGIQWHIFAAFSTLKGGRADWLIEKCTELGASSVTPLLVERSPTIADNRVDRLERVVLAAIKQCKRLHKMTLNPPIKLHNFLPFVSQSKLSFLAAAESTPLLSILSLSSAANGGLLIIGPEGDFTEEEVKLMVDAGATPVGLGPCRLRVETATIAMLSTLMLWSDALKLET